MEKTVSSPARRFLTAGACAATLLATTTGNHAHAATLSGDLRATLTLTTGCLVVGVPGSTTNIDFGVLDFGLRPSTFTGTITAVPSGGRGCGRCSEHRRIVPGTKRWRQRKRQHAGGVFAGCDRAVHRH